MKKIISLCLTASLAIGLVITATGCTKTGTEVGGNSEGQGQGQSQTSSESTVDVPEDEIEAIQLVAVNESISSYAMIEGEYSRPVDIRLSAARLAEGFEEKYPKLDEVLDEIEEGTFNEVSDQILTKNKNFIEELQNGGDPNRRYYDYSDLRVMRADSKVVSLAFDYSSYSGGPHGYNMIATANLDPVSGENIGLFDVVEDEEKFFLLVDEKLKESYSDIYDALLPSKDVIKEKAGSDLAWSLGNEGITIFFNAYELGSYDAGDQQVTIDFSENPGVFKEEYTKTRDSYIFPITDSMPAYIDLNKDGKKEVVSLSSNEFEDDYSEVEVIVNGETYSFQYGFNEPECYVSCLNGNYYLYILCYYENDYRGIKIVDLSKMEELDESFGGGIAIIGYESGSYEEEETGYEISYYKTLDYVLTNPDSMMLSSHMDFLGTWQSSGEYHVVNDNPMPVIVDGIYYRNDLTAFLTRKDVKCELVKADGTVVEESVIPKDSYVVMKRTDGESFVDVQFVDASKVTVDGGVDWSMIYTDEVVEFEEDEPIYRIKVEPIENEYYRNVDGSPESSVFDGIMYAG